MNGRAYSGDYLAHDQDQGVHTMTHTQGPMTVTPFLTPDEDDDPMMIYEVKGGDLQARFDNLRTDEDGEYNYDEVDAIHAENAANAKLIEDAFTVAHETGKTPRQLQEENRDLLEALKEATVLVEASYLDLYQQRGCDNINTKHVFDEMQRFKALIAKAEGRGS